MVQCQCNPLYKKMLLGNRARIFIRGCIKVPAPGVLDRGKTVYSPGPKA